MVCGVEEFEEAFLGEGVALMSGRGATRVIPSLALVLAMSAGHANAQTTAPAVAAPVKAGTIVSRGDRRAELLRSLLQGENEVAIAVPGAETPDSVETLDLAEAVAMAMKSNYEVLAADAKKSGTEWDVVAAYGQYAPQVNFTYATGSERSSPASYNDSIGNRVNDDTHHRRDRVWKIAQPLVDLSIITDILQRRKTDDMADAERIGVRERVALDTVSSYLKLIQGVLTVRYAERYKASLDGLQDRMSARVEGGGASRADLERVRSRAIMADSAIISSRSELEAAQIEFRRLVGVMPLKVRVPEHLLPDVPEEPGVALRHALAANPDYLASDLQSEVARLESDKAYSRLLPKLSFEVSRTTTYNAGGSAKGNPIDGGPWPNEIENMAMLVATWSFNGGSDLLQGVGYGERAREAQYKTLDLRRRLEESMANSYNALAAADKRIQATRQALAANTLVAGSFEEQYLAGSRQLFDLLDAYERLYSSRVELIRLITAEAQAAFQVRRQMGEMVGAVLGTGESQP